MNMPNRASRHQEVRWAASGSETSRAHWAFSNWTPNKKTHIKRIFPRRQSKDIRMFKHLRLALVIGAPQLPIHEFKVLLPIVSGNIVAAAPHVICHGIANRSFEPGHLHLCNARFFIESIYGRGGPCHEKFSFRE